MAENDPQRMLELLRDLEVEETGVRREDLHDQLEERGWEETRIQNAEDELYRKDAVRENPTGGVLTSTGVSLPNDS